MSRFRTRPALVLLGALLCLASCAPAAIGSASPTATTPPAPTNVPAGWKVLVTTHFSLAYPPDWTPHTSPLQDGSTLYMLYTTVPFTTQAPSVSVLVQEHVPDSSLGGGYCLPAGGNIQNATLAGLPMMYTISGEGLLDRSWSFANAQRTVFALAAGDAQSSGAIQAEDDAILATFRPDNATPWKC